MRATIKPWPHAGVRAPAHQSLLVNDLTSPLRCAPVADGISSGAMDSTQLTDEQYRRLQEVIGRHQRYYNRLTERMNRLFPGNDPMLRAAFAAGYAVQNLSVEVHYASCKHGVGR